MKFYQDWNFRLVSSLYIFESMIGMEVWSNFFFFFKIDLYFLSPFQNNIPHSFIVSYHIIYHNHYLQCINIAGSHYFKAANHFVDAASDTLRRRLAVYATYPDELNS